MTASEREVAPNIASLAALIGEPARAGMLWSLMGGQSRPAGELARIVGISPQSASAHLAQLVDGGLLRVAPKGRHRFFRLASPEVAAAIERLATVVTITGRDARIVSLVPKSLRRARRCWGHLAGELGVELHDIFVRRGWVTLDGDIYVLTNTGRQIFENLGMDLTSLKSARRSLLFPCPDWSERRAHLAGPAASALLDQMLALGYFTASDASRQLTVTTAGLRFFDELRGNEAVPAPGPRTFGQSCDPAG
jgi:DNA-binding transcriptional ArsR family regulator